MMLSPYVYFIICVYDFLLSDECNWSYIKKNVLDFPSLIMAVNGGRDIEVVDTSTYYSTVGGGIEP